MTWSDFEYQEEHGHLPDQGMTGDDLHEMFGDDTDPEEIREILALKNDIERHQWGRTWLTAMTICENCGLLPMDDDDTNTACPGERP